MNQSPHSNLQSPNSGLIAWFAVNPVAVNLLMLLIWVGGISSLWSIDKDVLPSLASEGIEITALYPGAGPSEVEKSVCIPLERAVFDLPGIKDLSSESTEGKCTVRTGIKEGYNLQSLISAIRMRTLTVSQLPKAVDRIKVQESNAGKLLINVILFGPTDELTLKQVGQGIRDDLLRIPGVIRLADFTAEAPYEVSAQVSSARLQQLQLSLREVADAVSQTSLDLPGGVLKSPAGELLLRTHGKAENGETLARLLLIAAPDGKQIQLGDVAHITDGLAEHWAEARFQGQPAYGIEVFARNNTVEVAERVKAYVAERSMRLPEGLQLGTSWDSSVSFTQRIDTLVKNGLSGFFLVFIVLMIFLHTRVAVWAVLGILTSVLGALWLMTFLDISLNMLSLFGFLLAMGVLVDDAIVIGENIHNLQTEKIKSGNDFSSHGFPEKDFDTVIRGAREMAQPVILAILTTVIAFFPGLLLPGWAGQMMQPICFVMVLVLAFSLVEALLILPAHLVCSHNIRIVPGNLEPLRHALNLRLKRFIDCIYHPFLEQAIRWRYLVLSIFITLLMLTGSLVAGGYIRLSLEADATLDSISAYLTLPPGLPYSEMRTLASQAERALFELRDSMDWEQSVDSPSVVSNLETSIHPEWTGLWVEIAPHARQYLNMDDFVHQWRKKIGDIGRAKINFLYKQGDLPYDIEIDLSDTDSSRLDQAAKVLKLRLATYPGVYDVTDSSSPGKPEVRVRLKPEGERLNLTLKDLAEQVRGAYYGVEAQRFVHGREEVKIMVRLPLAERRSLDALKSMPISLPSGAHAPLSSLAEIYFVPGHAQIDRYDRRPVLKVQARVDSKMTDVNAVYSDLESKYIPVLTKRFPQVHAEFGKERRQQNETIASLSRNFLIALVIIYTLIAIPFRSYLIPFVILLAAPVAWCGGVLAHWLMGLPLSMESLIGMTAASGVVVNDSLVLLDYIKKRRTDQAGSETSSHSTISNLIIEACRSRFRPILLAFLTTFVGILPLLLETSAQAQFLIPMALSLSAGLLFGLAASLVLTPVCYAILEKD
jgi:multidrug efflux pump subunit AcrB